jgi:predicted metal-dependent peptidase
MRSSRVTTPVELALDRAYVVLVCAHPFFATILLRLKRVEDTTAPTMWTDGKSLGYNPDFVLKLSRDELVGVLAHEVLHVAGLHPFRRGARKPRAWNIACDAVVNHIVQESSLKLPSGCIPAVAGKSAEECYVDSPEDGKGGNDPGGCGEVRDPTNGNGDAMTEAELDQATQEAKVLVQQAVNAAKRAGKFPAGLKRFADEAMEPRVPWREILARFIDGQAKNDYSWGRPNRRYLSAGILLPSLWSPGYGKIMFGCDTSGSIDQGQLKEICSEVLGCLELYTERGESPELTVAWFDHAVYPQTVNDADELEPKGGGGTSFAVVFDYMREAGEQPKAVVMVTDGYCSDFGEAPECPVLWVLTQQNRGFVPPFGELACVLND